MSTPPASGSSLQKEPSAALSTSSRTSSQAALKGSAPAANAPDWSSFLPVDLITTPPGLQRLQASLELLQECRGPVGNATATISAVPPDRTNVMSGASSAANLTNQLDSLGTSPCEPDAARQQLTQLQLSLKEQIRDDRLEMTPAASSPHLITSKSAPQTEASSQQPLSRSSSENIDPAAAAAHILQPGTLPKVPYGFSSPCSDRNSESINGLVQSPHGAKKERGPSALKPSAAQEGKSHDLPFAAAAQSTSHNSQGDVERQLQPRPARAVGKRLLQQQQHACLKLVSELLAPTGRSAKQD